MNLSEKRNSLKIVVPLVSLFISFIGLSQCDKKGITTNPSAPINPEATTTDGRLNNFDWRNLLYNINSSNTPSPIDAPFNQANNTLVNHFLNNRDNSPDDGWELIKHDLGFNYDGSPRVAVGTIFLVLYNKYRGTLRVFLQGNRNPAYNGAEITVYFLSGQKQSSILNNASKIWALDKYSQDSLKSVSPYNNDQGRWFYADFYMSYDPCTCFYESTLAVKTFLISKSNIQLSGSLVGTITPANLTSISNNAGTVADNKHSFDAKGLFNTAKKAIKTYNDFSSFASDQFKAIENEGKTNLQIKAEELIRKNSIDKLQDAIKKSDFLKAGLKVAPFIGAAVDLVDFFVGGGKSAPQEVTITPMAINATLNLKGTLTSTFEYNAITFYTPGSKNAQLKNVADYPKYNEVLGVFSLLRTPKAFTKDDIFEDYGDSFFCQSKFFQMTSNIQYVINPAAGYRTDNVEILANLVFKKGGVSVSETGYLPISVINNFSGRIRRCALYGGVASFYDEVYLKLLVNLTRLDSDPTKQNTLFVYTYQVEMINDPSFTGWSSNIFPMEQKLDQEFTGVFQNASLNGWRSSALFAQSTLLPNTSLTAGADFLNGPTFIPPVSATDVTTFCSTTYQNEPLRNFRLASENAPKNEDSKIPEAFLSAFPNPTTGKVSFHYYLEEPTQVRLNLVSTTGSIVATPVDAYQEAGAYEMSYDASNLPAGVYVYTLETNKGKETKRLVIIK